MCCGSTTSDFLQDYLLKQVVFAGHFSWGASTFFVIFKLNLLCNSRQGC
jgi:hypothetical protein